MIGYEVLQVLEKAVSLDWRTQFKNQHEFLCIKSARSSYRTIVCWADVTTKKIQSHIRVTS